MPASWGTGKPAYSSHPLKRGTSAAGSADWGVSRLSALHPRVPGCWVALTVFRQLPQWRRCHGGPEPGLAAAGGFSGKRALSGSTVPLLS